MSESAGVMCLS